MPRSSVSPISKSKNTQQVYFLQLKAPQYIKDPPTFFKYDITRLANTYCVSLKKQPTTNVNDTTVLKSQNTYEIIFDKMCYRY